MGATNSTRKLTVESIALLEMLEPNAVEVRNKALLQTRIQEILVKQWPTCRVLPFGSSENGLSFGGSDLDLGIYFEDAEVDYQNHLTTDERLELLSTVCACLGGEFEIQEFVQHARVPVVKLWDPKTQIACDVCLGSVHVLLNTALLKRYGEIDPRVRPLAFAVKYWAKQRGISDSVNGTLSSYGFALLLIYYLQSQSLLPPVGSVFHSILSEKSLPRVLHRVSSLPIDGLRPSFGSCEEESVGALLEGFFRFYAGEFSLEEDVVSVRTGKPLRKALTWTRPVAWRLSIEDPFELNHDVGRVIFSLKGQELLTNEFQRAYDMVSTGDRLEDVCAQDETVWSFSAACYICSAGSHKARECGQVALGRPEAGRASAVPDCWYCGQSGHVKSTCPLYAFVAGSSPVRRSIDHEMAEPTQPIAISSPVPIPATHSRVYDRSSPVRLVPAVPMQSPVRHGKKKKRPRQGSISSAASSPDLERSRKYMLAVAAASRKCGDRAKRISHTKFTGIRCVS